MGFNITITSKGQMTIPKELRDQLNVKAGDKCYAWVRNGEIVIVPRNKPLTGLGAMLGAVSHRAVTAEDMRNAIMDEAAARHVAAREDGSAR